MNYGITPPNLIDISEQEAKLEDRLEYAAARLRIERPELVDQQLRGKISLAIWYDIIKTGNTLALLELIDDVARKLVIDGVDL